MTQVTPPPSARPELVEGPVDLVALKVELTRVCEALGQAVSCSRYVELGDLQTCQIFYAGRVLEFALPISQVSAEMAIAPAYTLLRGLLEAYVRLEYLSHSTKVAWLTLMVEAVDDECRAIKDLELSIDGDKNLRLRELQVKRESWVKQGGLPNHSIEKKLKVLTDDDSTFGWMPVYRILCAKAHSRLTDMLRVEMSQERVLRSKTESWRMPDDEAQFLLKNSIGITQRTLQLLEQCGEKREAKL